jgi:hypothetical protein
MLWLAFVHYNPAALAVSGSICLIALSAVSRRATRGHPRLKLCPRNGWALFSADASIEMLVGGADSGFET